MYETKIPGTRYVCTLANVKGQWLIQIKLDDDVEAQVVVKDLNERGIRDNIITVLSEVNLYLNEFIIDQITTNITKQAHILLQEMQFASTSKEIETSAVSTDYDSKLDTIITRIETLEQRLERLEQLFGHQ